MSVENQSLVQFFRAGQTLGVYAVDAEGHLTRRGDDFSSAPPLPRRARLEVWKHEPQTLFRSPCPFDAQDTRAIGAFLNTVYELGAHLMPRKWPATTGVEPPRSKLSSTRG